MMPIVVKSGGSGNLVETPERHSIPWLAYRRLKFAESYMDDLIEGLRNAAALRKIVFVPGGMGAYLYLDLARHGGASDTDLSVIGCAIVNVNGLVAIGALTAAGISVCPSLVTPGPDLEAAMSIYRVVVVRAQEVCGSTDELAALAAVAISAEELIIFKKGVPTFHVGFDQPTIVRTFSVAYLQEIAKAFGQQPGRNSILDQGCLRLLADHRIRARLIDSDRLRELARVVENPSDPELPQTTIEV
jgi:uridylate kinase